MTAIVKDGGDPRSAWQRHRFLVLRRSTQVGVLMLFLLGPWAGVWIIKGNLNSSLALGVLPLSDPFVLVQSWLAGLRFGSQAVLGAAIVAAFYFLVGGRTFCAWVCPVNVVTDTAYWLRRRLGLRGKTRISRNTRYVLLAAVLLLAAASGLAVWEWVNPVSVLHRGILFGLGAGWMLIMAVFLFDLAVSHRGWCGHLCPMGAFYSLIGRFSPLRVRADNRAACDNCMDCFAVCPEPQVIRPALYGAHGGIGPVIDEANCTNCGRCIDVCPRRVFRFGTRFTRDEPLISHQPEHFEQKEART